MLSAETSSIITAYLAQLHAPQSPPSDVVRLYARDALITRTLALCDATARNTSSMAADAASGRMTEIDHINGYLISLADRLGIPAPHHQMVREMVKFTAEVTGLRHETTPQKQLIRIERRQSGIKHKLLDAQTRRIYLEDRKRELEEKKLNAWASDRQRTHRLGSRSKRKELSVKRNDTQDSKSNPRGSHKSDHSDKAKRTEQESPKLPHPKESASSVQSTTADEPVSSDSEKESEEQDEAVMAIESRIFSRSGRRGF